MKKVLILNAILYTPENGRKLKSINDSLLITVCRGFVAAGYEPTLIADSYYKPLDEEKYEFEILYFDHVYEKIFSPYKMPFPKGLKKYLKEHKDEYDFIVSSEVFSWYSLMAAQEAKEKLIVWQELALHNKMFHGYASRIWYAVVGKLFFKDVLIAPRSEKAKRFILQYCNNVDSEIYQHPIDINKFSAQRKKQRCFISVSQLVERKQVDKIIAEFSKFHSTHSEYELYVCGEGKEKKKLLDLTHRLGLNDAVHFTGAVNHNELSGLLGKAMALLIYTNKDNSILTISEAIASGTPVLTTPVPDNSQYVAKTNTGIVKSNWGSLDVEKIVSNNNEYINNCIAVREELTNIALAKKIIILSGKLHEQ